MGIYSTLPGGAYGSYNGTSMAAPHVTGAAALLLAARPDLTGADIKRLLTNSVDTLTGLSGKVGSRGRLNAASLIQQLQAGTALSATPATVGFGNRTNLTATVTQGGQPLAGRQVVLEQRPVGQTAWTSVRGSAGVVTDERGVVVQPSVSLDRNTDYRASVPGLTGSTSPLRRVLVRPVLTNTTATKRLPAGRRPAAHHRRDTQPGTSGVGHDHREAKRQDRPASASIADELVVPPRLPAEASGKVRGVRTVGGRR